MTQMQIVSHMIASILDHACPRRAAKTEQILVATPSTPSTPSTPTVKIGSEKFKLHSILAQTAPAPFAHTHIAVPQPWPSA